MSRRRLFTGGRIVPPVALALLIPAALASCGGETRSASGPSKAAFIRRANAICRARSSEIRFYAKPIEKEKGKVPIDYYLRSVATDAYGPAFAREIREIHALRPPEGDSDRIGVILHSTHIGVDRARNYPSPQVNAFARPERLAAEYGLTDCGHP